MQIFENLLSDDDIVVLKDYWEKNNHLTYKNAFPTPYHPYKDRSDFIDRRLLIVVGTPPWRILKKIVDKIDPSNQPIWCNYQRQSICHQMHVDEYGKDRGPDQKTYTLILALEDQPKFKTIVFKETANDNQEMVNLVTNLPYTTPRKNNSSVDHDLDHMDAWENGINYNCSDWLELDGVFSYRKGWGVLFDTNQLHTTSNWCKYPEFKYRDLVQIHFGKNAGHLSETHFDIGNGERPMEADDFRALLQN